MCAAGWRRSVAPPVGPAQPAPRGRIPGRDQRDDRARAAVFRGVRRGASYLEAGAGEPVVLLHGLGATKGSFLPTVAALAAVSLHRARPARVRRLGQADRRRLRPAVLRPRGRRPAGRARIDRAHLIGNSLGGRVALEVGLRHPERVRRWCCWRRRWPGGASGRGRRCCAWCGRSSGWSSSRRAGRRGDRAPDDSRRRSNWVPAGVDEFLRAYLTPRGRAAFYAAARQIYLEEPQRREGFWTRLARARARRAVRLGPARPAGSDRLRAHVAGALPGARHLELDCGHVPQIERPRQTHDAIRTFLLEA